MHPTPITTSWCVMAAAMAAITVVTIAGNVAVITALKRASPRFPTHYPLASLACADLMLGVFVLPLASVRELFDFQPPWVICACWSTLDVFCCTASILSLCTLGWERWSGITAPLARANRWRRAKLFAALIWPAAAAVALPTAFVPSPKHVFQGGQMVKACDVNTNIAYVFTSITFSFYLPASLMTVLYTRILVALATPPDAALRFVRGCRPSRRLAYVTKKPTNSALSECKTPVCCPKNNNNTSPKTPVPPTGGAQKTLEVFDTPKRKRLNVPSDPSTINVPSPLKKSNSPGGIIPRQRRATHTIIMLMSLFLICWTPFFVMLPIDSICDLCVSDSAWLLCTWLGYTNSALDPMVYAAASPTVRRAWSITWSSWSSWSSARETELTPPVRRRT